MAKRGKRRGVKEAEVDRRVLATAIDLAVRQPRVAFYSPFSSALLNYLKSVKPRFSISEEVAKLVEAELMRRYPLLGTHIRRALERSSSRVGVGGARSAGRKGSGEGA